VKRCSGVNCQCGRARTMLPTNLEKMWAGYSPPPSSKCVRVLPRVIQTLDLRVPVLKDHTCYDLWQGATVC